MLRRIILFFIIADFALLGVVGYWEYEIHFLQAPTQKLHVIEIQQGMGARSIASYLNTQGVVADQNAFLFYLWDSRQASHIIAGTYSIQPSATMVQLTQILTGKVVSQTTRVTIPEGSNLLEIQHALQNAGLRINQKDFLAATFGSGMGAFASYTFVPPVSADRTLEGYLFPDTYDFRYNATAQAVVNAMLSNFQHRALPEINKQHVRSVSDIIEMASILEKEVQTKQDMQIVAGILWKRLDAGQPLQVDATALYGQKMAQAGIAGFSADVFSTYLHTGLPPAPIGNPGLISIEAALNPIATDYWYYLSAPDGTTVFSKTLQEHDANRVKYLK